MKNTQINRINSKGSKNFHRISLNRRFFYLKRKLYRYFFTNKNKILKFSFSTKFRYHFPYRSEIRYKLHNNFKIDFFHLNCVNK